MGMKTFWTRLVSVVAICCILLAYNSVLKSREQQEEIAKLNAQIETAALMEETEEEDSLYEDGTFTGESAGYGGSITVEVVIEGGSITEVNVVSAEGEDWAYLTIAEYILPEFVEAQSADVDVITGATLSSNGIKNAVASALEKAME